MIIALGMEIADAKQRKMRSKFKVETEVSLGEERTELSHQWLGRFCIWSVATVLLCIISFWLKLDLFLTPISKSPSTFFCGTKLFDLCFKPV